MCCGFEHVFKNFVLVSWPLNTYLLIDQIKYNCVWERYYMAGQLQHATYACDERQSISRLNAPTMMSASARSYHLPEHLPPPANEYMMPSNKRQRFDHHHHQQQQSSSICPTPHYTLPSQSRSLSLPELHDIMYCTLSNY